MLRQEDWVLEQIDYQFLDAEDLQNTSLSTAASSSRFVESLRLDAPEVPLRPLFDELHDVRWLMAEMATDSVLVTISLNLHEIGVRGEAVVPGVIGRSRRLCLRFKLRTLEWESASEGTS